MTINKFSATRTDDPYSLIGRTAMVTGGSRGVGAGIARRLAAAECSVAVTYNRDRESAMKVVDGVRARGGVATAVQASAADADSWAEAADVVEREFGPIDILVSNAGTASRGKTVADTPQSEFLDLMRVHALGPLALIQRLLPGMRECDRSDIVTISSAIVTHSPERSAPYSMAKAAMESACMTLAREERVHGLHVNIVAPGLVDTDMGARLVNATSPGTTMSETGARAPFGRVCTPDDVADAVFFLLTAGYITGQKILVDGGGKSPTIF